MKKKYIWLIFWLVVLTGSSSIGQEAFPIQKFIQGAKDQLGVTLSYNPAYQKIAYPKGDVPVREGVCTDVIIRAFRAINVDLQHLVHEDMKLHGKEYPKKWGNHKPDTNIDHRRVPNLMTYFTRHSMKRANTDYQPGDMVVWDLGRGILHIGILSDKKKGDRFLVIHNICCGVQEEDILVRFNVVGHYRLPHIPLRT